MDNSQERFKSVFLCGFMGCGKSFCGKLCADIAGLPFCDMDEYIVSRTGLSIPEIFCEYGESGFRERETEAIRELATSGGVVACGGGAMANPGNAVIAKENGIIIFIDTPFDVCLSRIKNDSNRPIASSKTDDELEELYNIRRQAYLCACDCIVSGLGTAKDISGCLYEKMREYAIKYDD